MKKIAASLALVTCFTACNDDPGTTGATFVGASYDGAFTLGTESLPSFGGLSDAFVAKLAP